MDSFVDKAIYLLMGAVISWLKLWISAMTQIMKYLMKYPKNVNVQMDSLQLFWPK
jgi:hypothetical protein